MNSIDPIYSLENVEITIEQKTDEKYNTQTNANVGCIIVILMIVRALFYYFTYYIMHEVHAHWLQLLNEDASRRP